MLGLLPPLDGLLNSAAQFDHAPADIARATIPGAGRQDSVDLSAAAVALIQSRNSFDANTKAFKIVEEISQTLINTLG